MSKSVKHFTTSEAACIAAATLESQGIQATLHDESSFDDNLLGNQAASIWIEVDEGDYDRACELLENMVKPDESDPKDNGYKQGARIVFWFRCLLFVDFSLIVLGLLFPQIYREEHPEAIYEYLDTLVVSHDAWYASYQFYPIFLIVSMIGIWGLFFLSKIFRFAYAISILIALFMWFGPPPEIITTLGSLLESLHWMMAGAILMIAFYPRFWAEIKSQGQS